MKFDDFSMMHSVISDSNFIKNRSKQFLIIYFSIVFLGFAGLTITSERIQRNNEQVYEKLKSDFVINHTIHILYISTEHVFGVMDYFGSDDVVGDLKVNRDAFEQSYQAFILNHNSLISTELPIEVQPCISKLSTLFKNFTNLSEEMGLLNNNSPQNIENVSYKVVELRQVLGAYGQELFLLDQSLGDYAQKLNQKIFEKTNLYRWYVRSIIVLSFFTLFFLGFYNFFLLRSMRKQYDVINDKNQEIQKSLAHAEVLNSEVHHRVKNNLAMITSMLELKLLEMENSEPAQVLRDFRDRIMAIARVHEIMYQSHSMTGLYLDEYLGQLCKNIISNDANNAVIDLTVKCPHVLVGLNNAIYLGLISNELINNSLKHGFVNRSSGKIEVKASLLNDNVFELSISDDGESMVDDEAKSGIGFKILKAINRQLKGEWVITKNDGICHKFSFSTTAIFPEDINPDKFQKP